MLKKMKWRFTGSAMAAFTAVVLVLLIVINLCNYAAVAQRQDRSLDALFDIDQKNQTSPSAPPSEREQPFPGAFPSFSPEMQYMLRYFAVYCDSGGQIKGMNQDFIASISESDAEKFARHVQDSGRERGFYNGYRYGAYETDGGKTLIFLNSERELQGVRFLALQTGLIALGCLAAVFFLVLFLSKKAIAPYMRNIETQKRFITDAGHELKTPLTSISASADVLAAEHENDEWVENIQKQSVRLSRLIGNLVTLSRLDEERPFPEKAEFSLSEAMWEISEPFASLAGARGKEYSQHIEDGISMTGDENAIAQMVSILLDNAVRYSGEQGVIRLDVSRKRRKILISVYNTCRLSLDIDTEKLFDRFYRADESHSSETAGTGIGLSIAKATAEAHGGKLSAERPSETDIVFSVQFHV